MKEIKEIIKDKRIRKAEVAFDGMRAEIKMRGWIGSVIASYGGGWDHVSVAPYNRSILPSWEDMCEVKDLFFKDDECVVQYHPPKSEYVNNVNNCLHLWRSFMEKMPVPPSIFVGVKGV